MTGYSVENGSIASAQPSMAPAATAAAANHYAIAPQSQGMVGFSGPSGPAVDVIEGNSHYSDGRLSKPYHQHHSASPHQTYHAGHTGAGGGSSGQQRRSTSRSRRSVSNVGPDDTVEPRNQARSSSSRRSSGQSSSRHQHSTNNGQTSYHYSSQSQTQVGSNGGPTNAPHGVASTNPPQHHNYDDGSMSRPVGTQDYPTKTTASVTPPQDPSSAQSSYPPAVSTSNSHHSMHRRPAYLLHRDLVIGKGSYGQVCIASRGEAEGHTSGNSSGAGKRKKFACKCVVLRNDPKYIAKLQEEVNVLRELRGHDNVIRLYDVFCVDNELFIITELGRGGDLFHLLTTHPKHGVTEAYAAKTVAEMLSAVAFLHSRNICHRDLKLENWVLESGKDVWSPLKLIDFGLSTHFTPGHRLSRVVGSSYYVAPEVLKKSYTEACDLWSLGVIVYMLLSGAPPFYGKNDEAIKASIVQGEYTFPHELFRDVSDEAMAFVSSLLSYNTEYRCTADQALSHGWLATNCDPNKLLKAMDGARGTMDHGGGGEPMQLS